MSVSSHSPLILKRKPAGIELSIKASVVRGKQVAPDLGTVAPAAIHDVTVGQVVRLTAIANAPIVSVQWVSRGGGEFSNFTVTQQLGEFDPVTATMLAVNPLELAWSTAGVKIVGVTIQTELGWGYVEHQFVLSSPQVNYFDSRTAQVYVGPYAGGTFLRFGDPLVPQGPGIEIRSVLFGRQGARGRVGVLQIAHNERESTDTDGVVWHWSLNGHPALDVGPGAAYTFYQDEVKFLEPGSNVDLHITDAPAQQLASPLRLASIGTGYPNVTPESYDAYLMFKPEGGLWVPLSLLTWTWEGYSELEGDVWSPVKQPGNAVDPLGAPTAQFPTWSTNTSAGGWVQGVGLSLPRQHG